MPRPRKPKRDENETRDTPFRHVLFDFMRREWNRRAPTEPPMTQGQLAVRLGVPRTTLAAWLSGRITPPMDVAFDALARLGIPLQRLGDAYRELGLTVPPTLDEDTGPIPRPYVPPAPPAPPRNEWDEIVDRVTADARDIGMEPDVIAALIEHIRDLQRGHQPLERYIRAELEERHEQPAADQQQEQAHEQPSSPSQHQRRQRKTKDERPRTHSRPR